MVNKGACFRYSSLKVGHDDLKRHMRKLSDSIAVGVENNEKMEFDVYHLVSDIRYLSNQIGFHDSCIDHYDRDIKELMGTGDIIKEEVLKLS